MSSDSSTSSPAVDRTTPSAGTWSPVVSSRRSSSTTASTSISSTLPSRTTRARGALSTASRSRVRFARTSCTMPMSELVITTPMKSPSPGEPTTSTITNIVVRIALNRVSTLARTISPNVRLVFSVASLVSPRATRSRTSSCMSPEAGVSCGGDSTAGAGSPVTGDVATMANGSPGTVSRSCKYALARRRRDPGVL